MPPSPEEKTPAQGSNNNPIDLDSILLPKKETGPDKESAQRVNAGALLAQEEGAALPKPDAPQTPERLAPAPAAAPVVPAPPPPSEPLAPRAVPAASPASEVAPFAKPAPAPATAPTAAAPVPPVTPAPIEEGVRPLQTYKGDLERVVTEKGVSVVSIAAAEAERRGTQPIKNETLEEKDARGKTYVMIAIGVILIAIAGAVVALLLTRQTTVDAPVAAVAPFITVDAVSTVAIPQDQNSRDAVMTTLTAARQTSSLSLGLVEWLSLLEPSLEHKVLPRRIGAQEFLSIIAPQAPQELLRVLDGSYLLGVHSFDENQPFLLLKVDSYEVAYKAMLDWERTMRDDLSPLFTRNPSPHAGNIALPEASTSPQFLQTGFVDRVVENRDTRAVQNDKGDLLLLWTFLGRNLILVTTNEFTLREVLSRLSAAPVVPVPSQSR